MSQTMLVEPVIHSNVFFFTMDNIKGHISSYWYLYVRVMVFSYYGVWLRIVVPKIIYKQALFGLMDNVRGPIREAFKKYLKCKLFPNWP